MNLPYRRKVWMLLMLVPSVLTLLADGVPAQAEVAEVKVGQFITVASPITPAEVSRVQRAADRVISEHVAEGNRPILVFEIQSGRSEYHECLKLADFIRRELPGAEKTVAYLPAPLSGHAVMIALACQELVLHPDASIGDIGGEETIQGDQRRLYSGLAQDRRWPEALVLGMLDRDLEVVEIAGNPPRFALVSDLPKLKEQGVLVGEATTIKGRGEALVLRARDCRNLSLAKLLARDRTSLASQYGLPSRSIKEDPTLGQEPRAVVIQIDGEIDLILAGVVTRAVDRALGQGKNLLIFHIDSPGGRVDASLDIAHKIRDLKGARSIAYINHEAISGGAFVALACDEIYMASGATMGDAGPIVAQGGQFEHAEEKVVSYLAKQLSTIAEAKGRPGALAEAMVDRNLVVHQVRHTQTGQETYLSESDIQNSEDPGKWKRLGTVTEENRFLTVNGKEAEQFGLADELVESDGALWDRLGLESRPPTIGTTWVDTLVYYLNTSGATVLLIVLGMLLLYVEMTIPGITVAGIGSFLCFMLFFWSHMLGGTAGWLEVLLFLAGIGFIALEIFAVPGFGVTGVSGILMILASMVLASQTLVIVPGVYNWQAMLRSTGTVSLALVTFLIVAGILSRYLPSMPLFNRMVLAPPVIEETVFAPLVTSTGEPNPGASGLAHLAGQGGTATTDLRPAGKARFGNELVDVVAEGSYIAAGNRIEVIEISGNRIVVKQA